MKENADCVDYTEIPNALEDKAELKELFSRLDIVLFLDFDGTLSPIVNHPEDAGISEDMKSLLHEATQRFPVSIISGRDMDDLKNRVNLDSIIYAGSHGFRIEGPGDLHREAKDKENLFSKFQRIHKELKDFFDKEVSGVEIERKRYAIAIHYRNAPENALGLITPRVNEILKKYPDFKKSAGKKILEIKPSVDWHKGKALEWILDAIGRKEDPGSIPIYIGDDITDEDAFMTLTGKGLGILVGDHGKKTAADYRLKNVDEVKKFFQLMIRNSEPVKSDKPQAEM